MSGPFILKKINKRQYANILENYAFPRHYVYRNNNCVKYDASPHFGNVVMQLMNAQFPNNGCIKQNQMFGIPVHPNSVQRIYFWKGREGGM